MSMLPTFLLKAVTSLLKPATLLLKLWSSVLKVLNCVPKPSSLSSTFCTGSEELPCESMLEYVKM